MRRYWRDVRSRIENAYQLLGHRLGWRFLYTPASTLSPSARLALVGLNPGGSEYEKPILSVEAGSAYRVESWGADDTLNPLQVQVARLYAEISAHLTAGPGPIRLMDETLTANLCPFRAPAWDQLANPAASVLFSTRLWTDILSLANPRAVLCLGNTVERHLRTIMQSGGARLSATSTRPAGWGAITYSITRLDSDRGSTVLVRLPHLSRFGIVGRPQSRPAVNDIATHLARAIDT